MFLRGHQRKMDGKVHEYWSVVENRRFGDGRVVQRQVLYLGEIDAIQREAWRRPIESQDDLAKNRGALFPAGSMANLVKLTLPGKNSNTSVSSALV